MKLLLLGFAAFACLVLFTDLLDTDDGITYTKERSADEPSEGESDGTDDDEGEGEGGPKPPTLEEQVAALEESARDLARRARAVKDAPAALAGTDRALAALLDRLDELARNAGNLPRETVAEQLDALERDFEIRARMVQGAKETVEEGPDELAKERDALQARAKDLRKSAGDDAQLTKRIEAVEDALAAFAKPKKGAVSKEADALAKARARFHKGVTTLRARLG